ncbi:MAG TPA: efflux RND transporter periplasmic adaptor subunit [Thermoanaerobaculia bacterium]|nr:efflux RND transporter periplasmic adaptor subunit [Thermoanaerobaculia bacterium]
MLAACSQQAPPAMPARVDAPTQIVTTADLPSTRSVAGSVRAATVSPLAAKVMGNVVAVHVREGDRVRAGQLLAEIDDREALAARDAVERAVDGANAAVVAAEANAALAATNLKRFDALRERGSVSAAEFDEVRAKSTVANAEVERARRAREQLVAQRAGAGVFADYTKVRSPIDGIVTARFVDPGAQAAPGMPLLTVEDDRAMRVETSAPEDLAVRVGDPVTVEAAGKRIVARVTRVVAAVDAASRSAIVQIDLPAGLRSGTFVNVLFTTGTRRAVAVPNTALQTKGALASVFVVGGDGVARLRLVTAGDAAGDRVEILSGLDAGETIVTALQKVRDGARVR